MIDLDFAVDCSKGKLKSEILFVLISHFAYVQQGLEHLGPLVWKAFKNWSMHTDIIIRQSYHSNVCFSITIWNNYLFMKWQHNDLCKGLNNDKSWTKSAEQKLVLWPVVFNVNEPSYFVNKCVLWKHCGKLMDLAG